jgi:hypothetical protein
VTRQPSRRDFVADVVRTAAALGLSATPTIAGAESLPEPTGDAPVEWDLRWLKRLKGFSDRALFDWAMLGDPADPQLMWFAERYLQGCRDVYGASYDGAIVVLNIRTQAVPAALNDDLWQRYALGAEYKANDPFSSQPATRNPFWHAGPEPAPGVGTTSLASFVDRGAIILVCDFALGHLAKRLASKASRNHTEVHAELRRGLVPGAYAVPSGIFGMAKAQNAGCALVKP